jgi:Arc/MetJ-type ribon-helix-helix transcriptional regulator
MPREGWISISIPEKTINKIKKLIEQNPHLGYTSTSAYVTDALRRLFREHSSHVPRYLSVKIQENHIILRDNKLGRDVTVRFKTGGIAHCDHCDASDCEHIDYVLTLHEVTKFLKRRGWKRKN